MNDFQVGEIVVIVLASRILSVKGISAVAFNLSNQTALVANYGTTLIRHRAVMESENVHDKWDSIGFDVHLCACAEQVHTNQHAGLLAHLANARESSFGVTPAFCEFPSFCGLLA